MTNSDLNRLIRELKAGAIHKCRERIDKAREQPAAIGYVEQRCVEYSKLTVHLKQMRGL